MTIDYWQSLEEHSIYHIYNHAAGSRNLFLRDKDYEKFLFGFHKYFGHIFDVYAYCFMPNHFHLLVRIKSEEMILKSIKNIGSNAELKYIERKIDLNEYCNDQFRRWFSGYALFLNHRLNVKGQLFLKKVKRVSIDQEQKLIYLICYIHHNPIHHKFKTKYKGWNFCSYLSYLGNEKTNVCRDEILELFGSENIFIKLHENFKVDFENSLNLE